MKIESSTVGDVTINIVIISDYEHAELAEQFADQIDNGYTFLTSYEAESGSAIAFVFGFTAA
jgi:hypothetical protein